MGFVSKKSVKWEKEVDVVVVGYGSAGAVASIVAHDLGAEVLLAEKGEWAGGLSMLAGGLIKCARDSQMADEYLRYLCGGRVDMEIIQEFARGLTEVEPYLKKLAEVNGAEIHVFDKFAGQSCGVYPFPGRDTFYIAQVAKIPGFSGFPWISTHPVRGGAQLMKLLMDNIETRKIESWMSSPVRRLIFNENGIRGLVVERDRQQVAIRARRGVILASGGFEQSQKLLTDYLQGMPFYSCAPPTHTGDGILMAQEAGAALWHMWHLHASYGFKFPDSPIAFRHSMRGWRDPGLRMRWIVVDKFGRRYMNENHPATQDTNYRPMEIYDPDMPGYSRIPSYLLFDEVGRKAGPVAIVLGFSDVYDWSKDNSAEVAKGWILKGNSLQELARVIRETSGNEGRMEPVTLEATIRQWNESVNAGNDPLGRPSRTMVPLSTPPFYAVPVWPVISNTQGGPVHNVKQQVLNSFGEPIRRLYAAGELGSMFGHLYEQAGNLAECIISGRIAASQVLTEKSR